MSIPTQRYIFIYSQLEEQFDTLLIQLETQQQIEALKLRARYNVHRRLIVGEASLAEKEVELFNQNGCKYPAAFFNYMQSSRNYLEHYA